VATNKSSTLFFAYEGPTLSVNDILRQMNKAVTGDPDREPTKEEQAQFQANQPRCVDYITKLPREPMTPAEMANAKKLFESMRNFTNNNKEDQHEPK
jgi:hypothetical protein